jgi:hypothetical protein
MGYIYKIFCNITNESYYGKCNGKYNRLNCHICKSNSTSSKQIIERGDYTFSIIEDNIEDNLLTEREYYYITKCECINKTIPYVVNDNKIHRHRLEEKDRYYSNQEFYKKKSSKNYYKNKEKILAERKKKILCECGKEYTKGNKSRHIKNHNLCF